MDITVLDWLEATVSRIPEKTAFIDETDTITFGELQKEAKQIGSALLDFVSYGKPVAVMTGRHIHTPACFLGIVYSGGFYAPMDGTMPLNRLKQILEVIQAEVMLVDNENAEIVEKLGFSGTVFRMEEILEKDEIREADLAKIRNGFSSDMPLYAIFTSGSTGVPKGVVTSHYSLMTYIDGVSGVLGISESDRMGNQSPLDYIAAIRDVYFPVKTGASTVILPKKYFAMPLKLFEALNEYKVTALCWSTSALTIPAQMGVFSKMKPEYLKKVCFSGSVLSGKILKIWQENLPETMFVNQYGPTEATASCTYYVVKEKADENTVLPIGKPYRQYRIVLLNEDNTVTKEGEIGEICVMGPILALGYYNSPEKSRQSFIQNPENPYYREMIYKTGDLGRFREDGELEFHGRKDRQIKHLGHRVELGELEEAAKSIAGVEEVCALYYKEKEHLYLFYTGDAAEKDIVVSMRGNLPGFMVPRKIVKLEEMPALPNGKIDMVTLQTYFK